MRGRTRGSPRRAGTAGLAAALLAAAALAPAPVRGAPLRVRLETGPLRYELPRPLRSALPNGAVVLLLPDRTLPTISGGALFRAGSSDDPPERAGLAEVAIEALRSGGAGDLAPAAFEDALADLAASVECGVERDLTRCGFWSPASAAPRAMELFADLLRRPLFAPSAVRTARERRMEEARREEDEPQAVAGREFARRLYAGHPYGLWPDVESLSGIGARDAREFYARHCRPSGMVLFVAGDFDPEAMRERVRALFGDWADAPRGEAGRPGAAPEPAPAAPLAPAAGRVHVRRALSQTQILMGHRGPRWDDPDLPALDVLSHLLSYYRYHLDVRDDRGLAYIAYAEFRPRRHGGALVAYAGTRAEAARETLDRMRHHLEEVAAGRFSEEEARGSREAVEAAFVHRFATAADAVEEFARAAIRGLPEDWLPGYARRVAALEADDLRRVARRHVRPGDLLVVVVGEEEPGSPGPP